MSTFKQMKQLCCLLSVWLQKMSFCLNSLKRKKLTKSIILLHYKVFYYIKAIFFFNSRCLSKEFVICSPWASGRSGDTGWPDSSTVENPQDGKDSQWSTPAQPSLTDLVPEFEPGKPWKVSSHSQSISHLLSHETITCRAISWNPSKMIRASPRDRWCVLPYPLQQSKTRNCSIWTLARVLRRATPSNRWVSARRPGASIPPHPLPAHSQGRIRARFRPRIA